MRILFLIVVVLLGAAAGLLIERILFRFRQRAMKPGAEDLHRLGEALLNVKEFREDPKLRAMIEKGMQGTGEESPEDE